ncbi:hypothetical protein PRUPE_6G142300 [Prunus persica]|uniref:Protein kinase domain-containing protein n=1 Tax=Prunus persica TaxID=3760 RepID=A0A251NQA3_PRUPE|nr:hypothetical protein PRUPE_6G142300 [Prunus persica]
MSGGSLLFAAYTVLLLLLLLHVPSSCSHTASNDNSDCTRSCGNINISSPFRLKGDSKHCGVSDKSYELSCEAKGNGTTHHAVLYLLSGKYYVQAINYNNFAIRLVDAGVHKIKDNYFSHPLYSLTSFNFSYYSDYTGPYYWNLRGSMSIIFLSCENPMNPSDLIVETAPCISGVNNYSSSNSSFSNLTTYSYFIKSNLTTYDLGDSCKITLMVMVSPSTEEHMTSCKGIYNEIAHGFELSWEPCSPNSTAIAVSCSPEAPWSREIPWYNEIIMLIIEKVGYRIHPIYAFLGFDRLFSMGGYRLYLGQLLGCAVAPLVLYLAAKFTIGFPFVTALLIYKWRRRHLSMYENIEDFLQSNNNLMPIRYSYSDIKKMARGFKDKLGEGGYGSVYKAKLRSGHLVAIKMLGKSKTNNGQDFINEVATIGRIRHVNVVRLIGFCVEARGTMGYIAPELFYKNIGGVSYKADVYSFGMLLMEMAGRRKNLNAGIEQSSQFSQIYFPTWVSDQLKAGKDIEIGDDATDEEKKIIKKMMMVALWCIQMKPIERPSMNKVVEMLEGEIETLQMPPRPFLYPQQIPADEVGVDNRSPCASSASESEEITLIANAN